MSMATGRPRFSDLTLRVLTAVALIAVAVIGLWAGGIVFWVLTSAGALLIMAEWAGLMRATRQARRLAMFALSVPLAIMSPLAAGPDFFALGLLVGATFFVVIVTRKPGLAAGLLYAGLPVLGLLLIRHQQREGVIYAFWVLSLVWACDIGAYFAGRAIGGPKLAPVISPGKTWAGLAGGVVLATLWAGLLHWQLGLAMRLTLATPVLALVAQGGDLFESWLKRRVGVKDSGDLVPGHGGVMDRLDGLVPVAPLAAFLVILPRFYWW